MAERNVRSLLRLDRDREANDRRLHRIERIGFGVERDELGVADLLDPALELIARGHELVFARPLQRGIDLDLRRLGDIDRAHAEFLARRHVGGRQIARAARLARVELLQRRVELVALVQRAQRLDIALAQRKIGRAHIERDIRLDRRKLPRQRQLRQRAAQVLADLAADLVRVRDHVVERAVLVEPLRGRLRTALLDARNVVDAVAHQREQIDDALGRHAEFLDDASAVERRVAHRVDERDARRDELREILVAGRDRDVDAGLRRLHRQRADHVVGFDAFDAQDRKTERLDDREHRLDLRGERIGHRLAVGLVLGVEIVAERAARRVLHERGVVGFRVQRRAQHVDDAEQRAGRLAGRVCQRRQRMERAVEIR